MAAENIFISNARIFNKNSPHHGKTADIHVQDGLILKIGKNLKEPFGSLTISGKQLVVCPGFADLHVNIPDPGYEYKEDITSALNAAAAGGYTGVLSCSTTKPCVDNKSTVEYQLKKAKGHLTDLWVSGAISKGQLGRELAEMYDMHRAGAMAFYDFKSNVTDSQLMKLAMLYVKPFNGKIMAFPSESFLSSGGVVHEGLKSTENGLQGLPSIAEEIGIQRLLKLAEYTEQAIHFTSVSTTEGVDLIRKAKKQGIRVTCGVSIANLFFNDQVISRFDSNFKLNPPLREEKVRKALIEGLANGIIDVVVSDHWPQNIESKECEFEAAEFGMNTLESAFGMLRTATRDKIEVEDLVEILTQNPRKILGVDVPIIQEKQLANLTVFQADQNWEYNVKNSVSLSRNSSLNGELCGKIVAVINNGQVHVNA